MIESKSMCDGNNSAGTNIQSSNNNNDGNTMEEVSVMVDRANISDSSNRFGPLRYVVNNEEKEEMSSDKSSDEERSSSKTKKLKRLNKRKDQRNVQKISPGVNSYSGSVKEGKKAIVISTSITKGIRISDFNNSYKGTANFHRFHGGKIKHIKKYARIHLEEERPSSVVIIAGGNDLPTRSTERNNIPDIANDIIETGLMCAEYHVSNIFISSVLPRRGAFFQAKRQELNNLLRNLCIEYGFIFLENNNINQKEHIWRDDVHLNNVGSDVLSDNLLYHLNACT